MTEDISLIQRCKKGENKAQKALYDKYKSYWFTICLRYSNDRSEACDILQNGLVNIYTKLDQFNPKLGSFKAWSSRVVVNDCVMFLRKKKKYQFESDISDQIDTVKDTYDVISTMSSKEIINLIVKLPLGYRTVFNMYAIEGYSHEEISKELDISIGTSKSQLFKAKKLLKEKIEFAFS